MAKKNVITVYRGVTDVLPKNINPNFSGGGVFGSATYFALDEDTAKGYALGESESYLNFGVVCEYEIDIKNFCELSEDDFIGIESAMDLTITESGLKRFKGILPKKLRADKLVSAVAKTYSGLILEESSEGSIPEGNRQLILPSSSDIRPVLKSFTIFGSKALLESLGLGKSKYGIFIADIPAGKANLVSERLEHFLETGAAQSSED